MQQHKHFTPVSNENQVPLKAKNWWTYCKSKETAKKLPDLLRKKGNVLWSSFCCNFLSVPSVWHTDHDGRRQNVLHLSRRVHLCGLEPVSGYCQLVLVHPLADLSCKRLISCTNCGLHSWVFPFSGSTSKFSLTFQCIFHNSSWNLVFSQGVSPAGFENQNRKLVWIRIWCFKLVSLKFCCSYYRFQSLKCWTVYKINSRIPVGNFYDFN